MRLAACAAALLAAGCATLPPPAGTPDWPEQRSRLQALDRWDLRGRIAIAAGDEGFSGGLAWRQDGARAAIEMRGPLGGRALQIELDGAAWSVTDDDGVTLDGDAARRLLAERVGVALPIGEMRYWLVGVPAPSSPHEETLGPDGRLRQLEQGGWQVNYAGYRAAGRLALPARMDITTPGLRLRLAVHDWRIAP